VTSDSTPQIAARSIVVKRLGCVEYDAVFRDMQSFTAGRSEGDADEIWLLQHPRVYTVGLAGRDVHLPRGVTDIPVVHIDRGGQITYHGPGQVIAYVLMDMRRKALGVRELVRRLEDAVIDLLEHYGIHSARRIGAPGVYVGDAKIAALGLRIKRACCYHGLALNVDMDLSPFYAIDPCGYPGLAVTQLRDLGIDENADEVADKLAVHLVRLLA
jgi:lipoyl(octanoyl) transferase